MMSDSVRIKVPYKNLTKASEVELVGVDDEPRHRIDVNSSSSSDGSPNQSQSHAPPTKNASLVHLVLSCTVAAGVQFGWALQLSLLTPYIQVPLFLFLFI